MIKPLLQIHDLSVRYDNNPCCAVNRMNLSLGPGETIGLIGESGSGKSTLALSVMGLLPENTTQNGEIFYRGIPLHNLSDTRWRGHRWKDIALVFQNSLNVLNPLLTIEEQIAEALQAHTSFGAGDINDRISFLFSRVLLDQQWRKAYPHQLSGGMRQKVLIAMALACEPEILLVDEPTMALDAETKHQIVSLLMELQREHNFAMLVISHELEIINRMSTQLMVMYSGCLLETGPTADVINRPRHPYTRGLVYSSPGLNLYRDMWGIPGKSQNCKPRQCPFLNRCSQSIPRCATEQPSLEMTVDGRGVSCLRGGIVTLLRGEGIDKSYPVGKSLIQACLDCSIDVSAGEVAALIGESGSGKTTLGKVLSGTMEPDKGRVIFEERMISLNQETSRMGGIQMVYQDPLSSINSRFSIEEAVQEPLDILKYSSSQVRHEAVCRALTDTGLPDTPEFLKRRCYTLSGGQRQRIALARAMVMQPRLLIADEISAMLDPSTAANILRLLKGLQNERGFSMIYITHDLALARKIADTVFVMKDGKIVESGPLHQVFDAPQSVYTERLVAHCQPVSALAAMNETPDNPGILRNQALLVK